MAESGEADDRTGADSPYDMFRRDLDVAGRRLDAMLRRLRSAEEAVHWEERTAPLPAALDDAWRAESALGAFLAMDDIKAAQAGYGRAKAYGRRAFDALRPPLRDGELKADRPDHELQGYVKELVRSAEMARTHVADATASVGRPEDEAGEPVDGRATVALARTEDEPDAGDVARLVREAVDRIGGIERFVRPGQTVLIKPNQTVFLQAHEGVTTDPRVVAALVRLAREAGADRVQVGESSGGGGRTREVLEVTGMLHAAERAGAEVVPFDEVDQREVEIPGARHVPRIALPVPLLDADVVINVPKLKTHHMDPITGAIKNWVGCVRADIREHHHDWNTYQEYAEIMTRTRPALNVMDGIVLGEGNGPVASRGRFHGVILASADPVALDVTAARMIGFDPRHVTFATVAAGYGLGQPDPDRIDLVGAPFDRARTTVEVPRIDMDYIDANIIVGLEVSHSGSMGHFKSVADFFHRKDIWTLLVDRVKGRPTVLIGDAEDPLFRTHRAEGPYLVIDDAAPAHYRDHPDVFVIPGHPVLHNMMPLVLEGLGISKLGRTGMELMQLIRRVRGTLGRA